MDILNERFWAKVQHDVDTGCWNWVASHNSSGYGLWAVAGKPSLTHRISYEAHVGPIPEGLQIDHLCRNRSCCNPEHLEPVTAKVNMSRTPRALKTHCVNGHPLSGDNLYVTHHGRRNCRECAIQQARERRAARRADRLANGETVRAFNGYRRKAS